MPTRRGERMRRVLFNLSLAFRLIIRFSLSGKRDFSCPAGRLVREVCLFGVFGVIIRDFCLESYANQLGSRALELFSTKSNTSSNFDTGGCAGAATQLCAEGRKPGFCPGKRDAHPRVSATGLIASLDPRPVDRRESSVASGIPVSVSQHDEKLHLGSWRSWSATGWRCAPWSRCRCWARGSARAKGHAHQVTGVERTARGR